MSINLAKVAIARLPNQAQLDGGQWSCDGFIEACKRAKITLKQAQWYVTFWCVRASDVHA